MSTHHSNQNKRGKELTRKQIIDRYELTSALISRYLPPPRKVKNRNYKNAAPVLLWKEETVEIAIRTVPQLRSYMARRAKQKKRSEERARDAIEFLEQFSPENLFEKGKELKRHFILHVGPTNSGKTYEALQALKEAETGVYLGPLRLLALEVAETLNADGVLCSLLTGEECIEVPFAEKTASTVELLSYRDHYDVAVIDEAQMIADPFRGPHWVKAISLVDAEEVHVCLSPEALPIVESIIGKMGAPYEIREHQRLVPLEYRGLFRDLKAVEPGDALIAFSRKKVLQIAAELEKNGIAYKEQNVSFMEPQNWIKKGGLFLKRKFFG